MRRGWLLTIALLALSGAIAWFSLFFQLDGGFQSEASRSFVLFELRLPRLLIGFIVGAVLGLVGAAFQTLFQNPLATPSTVGTTAGATLGALVALVFGLRGEGMLPAVSLFAFLGALLTSLSVARSQRARVEEILLAGIAITLATGAISQGLHSIAQAEQLFAAAQWSLGQLPQVGYERTLLLLAPALLCVFMILSQGRGLQALSLGEDWARSVGVETTRVRTLVILGGCLGVGTAVALCGPIAFVGLLVPHLVRRTLGEAQTGLLPLSALAGGTFLCLCDALARFSIPDHELPVGVLTASLGAPALFLLILRRNGSTR